MPKAARKGDRGRHDKEDLTAVQGSPNVFINGQPAVRVGDVYQSKAHPASSGSATVNINGKAAVRVGDKLAGHATASSGSPNVFIGDHSHGAAKAGERPVYEILLSQVPGVADPSVAYRDYPYKLYHNGRLVQQGKTDVNGIITYEYEPPLKGKFKIELFNGDVLELDIISFAPADTRRGVIQRLNALGYFHAKQTGDDVDAALRESNSELNEEAVNGVLPALRQAVKAKMP